MSSLDELIGKAKLLHSEGHSPSQIADELSLSMETVTWLLTQQKDTEAPKDIHINWTVVGGNADMLRDAALLLLKRYYYGEADARDCSLTDIPAPELVVGVAHSGIPLATIIAAEEGAQFTMYHPKKHAQGENPVGSISGNFAQVQGRHCLIIDDVITSGNTMKDIISHLRNHGAVPEAVCVLFNKRNIREIDGVPVFSLFQVSRID
ncbi:orotate phosphoribosyltransferase-like protein [Methanogenium sp. S4BF]|uniref:orotate phosphoribosyltransferase-like protein n=1 Tax=Methanogenium sp. S4BF TaxID=1789226 RepID=UPI002417916A|nr:orotate phosphoribosyltransferase-like protein [Methanogenium sp. S4BF]WFN33896.1 orotate phosphoribosyltransferase-like protein [Methanogenium sp. S4BF]